MVFQQRVAEGYAALAAAAPERYRVVDGALPARGRRRPGGAPGARGPGGSRCSLTCPARSAPSATSPTRSRDGLSHAYLFVGESGFDAVDFGGRFGEEPYSKAGFVLELAATIVATSATA